MYWWSQFQQRQTKSRGGSSFPACRHVAHTGFESAMSNSRYCQICNAITWTRSNAGCKKPSHFQEPAPPQYTPSAQQTVTNADFQVVTLSHSNLFVCWWWIGRLRYPGKCFSHWWIWKPQLTLPFPLSIHAGPTGMHALNTNFSFV